MVNETTLKDHINSLIKKHGTLRAVAESIKVSPGYLGKLKDGYYENPSNEYLEKLGLERKFFRKSQERELA